MSRSPGKVSTNILRLILVKSFRILHFWQVDELWFFCYDPWTHICFLAIAHWLGSTLDVRQLDTVNSCLDLSEVQSPKVNNRLSFRTSWQRSILPRYSIWSQYAWEWDWWGYHHTSLPIWGLLLQPQIDQTIIGKLLITLNFLPLECGK